MQRYQLIVVGAGPAGFCAAVAAARLGVRTLLAEQYGMLGGAMTVGGVPYPMNFAAGGRQVISGVGWELMQRLLEDGWAKDKSSGPVPSVLELDPVMTACEMDRMACEAGVRLLLNCKLAAVRTEAGRVISASFAAPEGLIELEADMWIDATGDGQLSKLAGAAYEMGDPQTGEVQPGTLGFWMDGFDAALMKEDAIRASFKRARAEGVLKAGDYYGEDVWPVKELFAGHGLNKNHVAVEDVTAHARTAAAVEGRAIIRRVMNWAKRCVPDASGIYGAALCPEAWVRESRRVLGRSYITARDYRAARRYPDGVCYSYYPMDVHQKPEEGKAAFYLESHTLSPDHVPSIPLGAMIVRDFHNLMTAGRCISGDRMSQSAYRVQATCMAMGQAAGTAADLQSAAGAGLDEVDPACVRESLSRQGAIVPD